MITRLFEKKLKQHLDNLQRILPRQRPASLLIRKLKTFVMRKSQRIRPFLFLESYEGLAKKPAPGRYDTAVGLELLHNFVLIHDDIVDRSDIRRGKPSLHKEFGKNFPRQFVHSGNGADMALIAGDVLYAAALQSFLSIEEKPGRKEKALKHLLDGAVLTGYGEFAELQLSRKNWDQVSEKDILSTYDCKTAYYTCAIPLALGAILAGKEKKIIDALFLYGTLIGRAYQIKDDIVDIFGNRQKTEEPTFSDVIQSKKTLIIWHAYRYAEKKNREFITSLFSQKAPSLKNMDRIRNIIRKAGSLDYAMNAIRRYEKESLHYNATEIIKKPYRNKLHHFIQKMLSLNICF